MSSDGKLTQTLFLSMALCYDIFMSNFNNDYDYNNYYSDSPGPAPQSPGPGPGTPSGRRNPSSGNPLDEIISWAIDVGMIFVCFPVGLVLTISHAMGSNLLRGLVSSMTGSGKKRASTGSRRSYSRPAGRSTSQSSYAKAQQASARRSASQRSEAKAAPEAPAETERFRDVRKVDAGANVLAVFGWVMVALGVLFMFNAAGLWAFLTTLAVSLGGFAMVGASSLNRRQARKYRRCMTISGDKGIVDMKQLGATLGMEAAALDKMLTDMVDRGYYGERAYIDHQRGLLVIDPEEMRDVYRREDEAKKTEAQRAQEARMSEYERIIEQIRQADLDIDDEAMSEKIRRMQSSTAAIFKEVEAHPEKKSQIERFMNYYLPTTLKLLNSYARIEQQGVSGQNMAKAKADIERIADTLVAGYEKQLDTLYSAEAIDIAGDVGVIENMMRRDGLSGSGDFSIRPQGGTTAGGT